MLKEEERKRDLTKPEPLNQVMPTPAEQQASKGHWLRHLFIRGYYTALMEVYKIKYDWELARNKLGRWHMDGCHRFVLDVCLI